MCTSILTSPEQEAQAGIPSSTASSGWGIPRPWSAPLAGPSGYKRLSLKRTQMKSPATSSVKKTIPVVTLRLSENGHIAVCSTVENVYVKVPEESIGVESLLNEVGKQLDPTRSASELYLLDSKLVVISPSHAQTRGELSII